MGKTLADLNDHLFEQLNRLSQSSLKGEDLDKEVKRAHAIVGIGEQIAVTADLQLKAAKLFAEHGRGVLDYLPQIGGATVSGTSERKSIS